MTPFQCGVCSMKVNRIFFGRFHPPVGWEHRNVHELLPNFCVRRKSLTTWSMSVLPECVWERAWNMQNLHTTTPLSRFPKKMVPEVPCLLRASWSVCMWRGGLGVRRKLSCLMIQGNLRECSPPLPSLKRRHSSEDSVEEPHSHSQQFPVRWRVHRKGLRLNRCSKWRLLSCSHVVEKYRNQAKSN